jgi:hypothetical protein
MLKYIIYILLLTLPTVAFSQQVSCYTKTEVGESLLGLSKIYETTEELIRTTQSNFDFSTGVIIGSSGNRFELERIADNLYKIGNYYYLTNDDKTIVTETTIDGSYIYTKVLFCERI